MNSQPHLDILIDSMTYRFNVSEPSFAVATPNTVLVVSERKPYHGYLGVIFAHKYVAVGNGGLNFASVFPISRIAMDHAVLTCVVNDIAQRKAVVGYFMDYIAEAENTPNQHFKLKVNKELEATGNSFRVNQKKK